MKLIQKSHFRVQGMSFLNIVLRKIKTRHTFKSLPYLHRRCSSSHRSQRDEWRYQNRWIFGKFPNGLWPLRMVPFPGNHIHVFHAIWPSYILACTQPYMVLPRLWIHFKKFQHNFPKMRGRGVRNSLEFFPKIHLFWYHYPSLSVLSVKSDRSIMSIICVLGDLSVVFLSEVVAKCLNDLLEKPQWWYLQGSWMMYISNLEGLISYNPQIACVRIWRLYDQMCAHCRVDQYEWHYNELLNPKGRFGAAREAKNHHQAWMESTYVDVG